MLALWMYNTTLWGSNSPAVQNIQKLVQPSPLGQKFVSATVLYGPTSYNQGIPPKCYATQFEMTNMAIVFGEGLSTSGTYFVRCQQNNLLGTSFATVRWFVASTGAEVPNGTNLSVESVRLAAIGN